MIDDELKQLAALALRNAFWQDFSALVNKYLEAAAELDVTTQESMMGEMTSIYGRSTEAKGAEPVNIWTRRANGHTAGHRTILEALEHTEAIEVHIEAKKVFERQNGTWRYVG